MELIDNIIDPLIDKLEVLGHTQIEIYKYRLMLKSSALVASLISMFFISFFLLLMAITFNIALGNWVGVILGSIVHGYIIVAVLNALIALFIYVYRSPIRNRIQDTILTNLQN
jgi:hypothetical protein